MKQIISSVAMILFSGFSSLFSQICDGNGNVVIFANYDGGQLTINVDQDIPNLKIGICTYEAAEIFITGPYVGNVTEVIYAGYNANNNNCGGPFIPTTSVTGVAPGLVTILFAPPATLMDAEGYGSIICAYSCNSGYQGGCNTAEQIVDYFLSEFGGSMFMYYTQYNCWSGANLSISNGGNCCPGATPEPVAFFSASSTSICAGDCINFTDQSSNIPNTWNWTFTGANPGSSNAVNPTNICYDTAGSYTASLLVSNAFGSDTYSTQIEVIACAVPGCTYPQATNYNPLANDDDGSCIFVLVEECNCPGDLDGNGVINVADLLDFMGSFGTKCPN